MAKTLIFNIANKRLVTLIVCIVVLLACLITYVWVHENDNRSFKDQVHLLGISEHEMRDYTNTGCAFWHHEPKDISYAEECYSHAYARYRNSSDKSAVKERLESNGWVQQDYKPDFFIKPRGIHGLDVIFFKNVRGSIYCAGIEQGDKTFNLHVLSSSDDNCREMVGSSPNSISK